MGAGNGVGNGVGSGSDVKLEVLAGRKEEDEERERGGDQEEEDQERDEEGGEVRVRQRPEGLWGRIVACWHLGDQEKTNAPHLPILKLFLKFLLFGCQAFGGPMAQIAMMKQHLVVEEAWITVDRFNRVLAVYQALPGPEATELACYFGLISRGRLGAIVAGTGFLLPGFLILLTCSWAYATYGIESAVVQACFAGVQPIVAAMILRAIVKLSEHAFQDQETKQFSLLLGFYGLLSFFLSVLGVNFFISLILCGVAHTLVARKRLWAKVAAALLILAIVALFIAFAIRGLPGDLDMGEGIALQPTLGGIFLLGLLAGLLTFGGAYTTIPFVAAGAVATGWLTEQQFMDSLAITNIAPTPLVMFVTMVGFLGERTAGGSGFAGATLMSIAIFLPAFSFTLVGHNLFERVVESHVITPFLDGVTASVMGLVLITALEFVRSQVTSLLSSVVFFLSLAALFYFNHKFTQPIVLVVGAIASQVLFV